MDDDEVLEQIARDELLDRLDQHPGKDYVTPREFARLQHVTPQAIYYHIRNKHLKTVECLCGRTVLNYSESVIALEERRQTTKQVGENE